MILQQNLSEESIWIKSEEKLSNEISTKLSEIFCLKPAKKVISVAKSNCSLQVISAKSAQNLLILLRSQFKRVSHEEIKKCILRCNTTMLNEDFINQLIKSVPQPYQVQQLRKMKFDGVQLIDAEEFLAGLCDIPRLVPRLHCIKFKIGLDDTIQNLQPGIQTVTAAFEQILECVKFHKILLLIRSIGNVLNDGSNIGGAVGFELSVLSKLNDVKGTKDCKTLLHFIIDTIEKKYPEWSNFGDELPSLHEAVRANTDNMHETMDEIDGALDYVRTEVKSAIATPTW